MSRKWWTGMAMAAAVLAATALASVQSRNARVEARPADLTGIWTLDPSRSDLPGGFRGARRRGQDGDRPAGESRGRRTEGRRGPRMARTLHVTQQGDLVSLSDSTGALVEVIRTGAAPSPDGNFGGAARELTGHWEDGTLVAEGSGPRGGTVVRTYRVTDGGHTLEVRTRRQGGSSSQEAGPRRSNRGQFTLVYRRAS